MIMRVPAQDAEFDDSDFQEQNAHTDRPKWQSDTDEYCCHIGRFAPTLIDSLLSFEDLQPSAIDTFGTSATSDSNTRSSPTLLTMPANAELQWTTACRIVRRQSQDCVLVRYGRSRRLILPSDHRLMCFDRTLGQCCAVPISSAARMLSPRIAEIPDVVDAGITTITGYDGRPCELTRELGWWIGCVIGNGWVCSGNRVYMCGAIGSPVLDSWAAMTTQLFGRTTSNPQDRIIAKGAWGTSRKISVSGKELANWLSPKIGHGAGNKHIPDFVFHSCRAFQLGLVEGLFDTDGTLKPTKSGRFNVAYTTKSPVLCRQLTWLLMDLGVDANYQLQTNNFARKAWVVLPSVVDFHAMPVAFTDPARNAVLQQMRLDPPLAIHRTNDILPLSHRESRQMCDMFRGTAATRKKDYDTNLRTMYCSLIAAKGSGHIGRYSLSRIVTWLGDRCPLTVRERLSQNVHWEPVRAITSAGSMDVLDIHFDDPELAIVGDYGIPVFASPVQ